MLEAATQHILETLRASLPSGVDTHLNGNRQGITYVGNGWNGTTVTTDRGIQTLVKSQAGHHTHIADWHDLEPGIQALAALLNDLQADDHSTVLDTTTFAQYSIGPLTKSPA